MRNNIGIGLGIGVGVITFSLASYDTDAQAFFNRVATAGGTTSTTEKNAVNTLVLALKSAGIWSSMKAIYPMVGASAAACAQNLKSSSFTGTFSSGWTFASTGVTPNGTSTYMNTFLNPTTISLSNVSTHMTYYSRTIATGTVIEMGGSGNLFIAITFGVNSNHAINRGNNATTIAPISTGLFLGNRINNTNDKLYKNGVVNSTFSSAATTTDNQNIYIGRASFSASFCSTKECAFASIGDGLTDTQAADLYNAVQTFQTTLNRQIAP